MQLETWILRPVRDGKAVLFLGAGASAGATHPDGRSALKDDELRDLISDRFLGGARRDQTLARVADYAKVISSSQEVEKLVAGQFEPLRPAMLSPIAAPSLTGTALPMRRPTIFR